MVDTEGFLLKVVETAANVSDKEGFCRLLEWKKQAFGSVIKVWGDNSYQGEDLKGIAKGCGIDLEVVKRPSCRRHIYNEHFQGEWIRVAREFTILPRRWVVERTFGWLGRNRHLSKEYDYIPQTNWIYLGMVRLIIRRPILKGS